MWGENKVPLGLTNDQLNKRIFNMNDGGRSFNYIADWLEKNTCIPQNAKANGKNVK